MGLATGFNAPTIGWLTLVESEPNPAAAEISDLELAEEYLAELQARRRRAGFHIVENSGGDELLTAV